ncbi:MAG TPA: AAA family ATPase [Terriglobales bacterium]|nr:AAA family ATPase [Terriglobales bacterium]
MPRPAVAIALPPAELAAVGEQLAEAGYEPIEVKTAEILEELLNERDDIGVAILDGEYDFDRTLEMYALLHENGRNIPSLMVVAARALDRMSLAGRARANDEYFTRPYSAESLRWRVEAMLIRAEIRTSDSLGGIIESHGGLLESSPPDEPVLDIRRGQIVIVFNPKGGVGKTTIAVNVASLLQIRKGQRVLLVDCDTVTGHVASSLGLENTRTVADAWTEELDSGVAESFAEIAAKHQNGLSVLAMAESPLHTEILEPKRVAEAITSACGVYDWVIVDMHPDYGPLNQVIFERADKIIVPVTPDVPAIRAAVQFREVAVELEIRERLAMVVNRANSGVSVADMERTVGMPALAEVRSAGMLFVRAANEGRSAVERFPKEKVIDDIETLCNRMMATKESGAAKSGQGFLGIFSGGRNTNPSMRAS